jgi:hydroxymethylglutaryl-CoA lyase
VFDSSVAGLGGCPYAPGGTGNVATEDLIYLWNGLGVETGVDLQRLVECADWISKQLGRAPASRVTRALLAKRSAGAFKVGDCWIFGLLTIL